MPASNVHLSCPGASRLACGVAALALIAAAPAAAQPVPRVPVPATNTFATHAAGICGTGAGPYSPDLPNRPGGCVVPRTAGCPPFRLKINHKTGEVTTTPLEPGHVLLQLDQWERFKRSHPAGK